MVLIRVHKVPDSLVISCSLGSWFAEVDCLLEEYSDGCRNAESFGATIAYPDPSVEEQEAVRNGRLFCVAQAGKRSELWQLQSSWVRASLSTGELIMVRLWHAEALL